MEVKEGAPTELTTKLKLPSAPKTATKRAVSKRPALVIKKAGAKTAGPVPKRLKVFIINPT